MFDSNPFYKPEENQKNSTLDIKLIYFLGPIICTITDFIIYFTIDYVIGLYIILVLTIMSLILSILLFKHNNIASIVMIGIGIFILIANISNIIQHNKLIDDFNNVTQIVDLDFNSNE